MRAIVSLLLWIGIAVAQNGSLDEVYVSTDVPVPIPDGPDGIAESILPISDCRLIVDLNVVLTIMHTFDGDLRIYLEAPDDHYVVTLAYQCGQSGDNYINTTFDDEAQTPICQGNPPFTGVFRPHQPLYEFDGLPTYGTWILRVTDNYAQDIGTIEAWRLEITLGDTCIVAADPIPAPAQFTFRGNFPNPFNSSTEFRFSLARDGDIKLLLFDVLGRQAATVIQSRLSAGEHSVSYDAGALASGVYFAMLGARGHLETRKIVLMK